MFSKFDVKKFALWVFIAMMISFAIAGSIFSAKGINGTIFSGNDSSVNKDIDEEKSFNVEGIKDIEADTVSTDIKIIPSDTKEIKVHFYGNVAGSPDSFPKLIAEQSNNKLNIQVKHKLGINIGINFHRETLKLDIFVPKSFTGNMVLNTVSGNANIEDFNLNKFKYNSTSGELYVSSLNSKDTMFNSVSGNMKANNFTGDLDFSSTSGELEVEYNSFNNKIKVNTVSGDSQIKLPENSEFNIKFNSTSGDFESNFPLSVNKQNRKHDVEGAVGSSQNSISVNSVSGELRITK